MKTFLPILVILLFTVQVVAQSCPFDVTDDPYPGDCGRYIDRNTDGHCDLGETDEVKPKPTLLNSPPTTILQASVAPISTRDTQNFFGFLSSLFKSKYRYNFTPLAFTIFIIYLVSSYLAKTKRITLISHRKIWNVLLLITFIISCGLGVLLVFRINYGWTITNSFNMLYLHVEAGIAMTVISVFHILWHWDYYKNMLKRK